MNFKLITIFLIFLFFVSGHCIFAENPDTGDFQDYNGFVKELTVNDAKEIINETAEELTVNDAKEIINETAEELTVNDSSYPNNQIITNYELQSVEPHFGDLFDVAPIISAYKIKDIYSEYDWDSFKVIHTDFGIDLHTFTLKIRIADENNKNIPHCPFCISYTFTEHIEIFKNDVYLKSDPYVVELMTDENGYATFTVIYQPSSNYIKNSVKNNSLWFYLWCKHNDRIWDSRTIYV